MTMFENHTTLNMSFESGQVWTTESLFKLDNLCFNLYFAGCRVLLTYEVTEKDDSFAKSHKLQYSISPRTNAESVRNALQLNFSDSKDLRCLQFVEKMMELGLTDGNALHCYSVDINSNDIGSAGDLMFNLLGQHCALFRIKVTVTVV